MKVFIEKTGKTVTVKKGFKAASELLKELQLDPDAVIIVKDKEVILLEEPIEKGSDVTLLSVVSGG